MKIHFVGICGIGMSGLAQAFHSLGHEVSGSDREISPDGVNAGLISFFVKTGIRIFPQDGSFAERFRPDMIVYSTAIENDNPDFRASEGTMKIHRSEALRMLLEAHPDKLSIAVTGTSGKTTVSAWTADALCALGLDPAALIGGKAVKFACGGAPGNFRSGAGRFIVVEADESDKSILNYAPDFAVILNTGPDHYPVEEQNKVFAKFAESARKAVVCAAELLPRVASAVKRPVFSFGEGSSSASEKQFSLLDYSSPLSSGGRAFAKIATKDKIFDVQLPVPGHHNAINASTVMATLRAIGATGDHVRAIGAFSGVERRFRICGRTAAGALVIDDYAHNPDKIASCIRTAKELAAGRTFFVFQPHGYGPLGFMQDKLRDAVRDNLSGEDRFILLPVFYAGGTTSFKPRSEDVAANFANAGIRNCEFRSSRDDAEELLSSTRDGDVIVVAGARDESLSQWARRLAGA